MDDAFRQRVRAAATAAWWTVLIAVCYLTLVWILFVAMMSARPSNQRLCGLYHPGLGD
jgi:hypothetical protein